MSQLSNPYSRKSFSFQTTCSRHRFSTIQAELPNNVYVKRMPKGWNNTREHCIIIRILRMILAPFLHIFQPIILFDAVPLHLADEVMTELATAGIWYLVIPSRLTWLLQPLDTHAFAKCKRYLKTNFQDHQAAAVYVNVTLRMIRLVLGATRHVLQGFRWDSAFQANGFSRSQRGVPSYIQESLEFEALPMYLPLCPTAEIMRLCWPRNRTLHEEIVWTPLPADGPAAAPIMAAASPFGS